jgi:hypothetical protein
MFRDMAGLNKHRWIEILPRILAYYNTRKHSSLGMSPTEASRKSNEALLWTYQYGAQRFDRRVPPKFQLGDLVRISRKKGVFERGFDQNWTREVFVVNGVGEDDPPVYFLKDMLGEPPLSGRITSPSSRRRPSRGRTSSSWRRSWHAGRSRGSRRASCAGWDGRRSLIGGCATRSFERCEGGDFGGGRPGEG